MRYINRRFTYLLTYLPWIAGFPHRHCDSSGSSSIGIGVKRGAAVGEAPEATATVSAVHSHAAPSVRQPLRQTYSAYSVVVDR